MPARSMMDHLKPSALKNTAHIFKSKAVLVGNGADICVVSAIDNKLEKFWSQPIAKHFGLLSIDFEY